MFLITYLFQWDSPSNNTKKHNGTFDDNFEPWSARKSAILSKFTTSEKLSMVTSFLAGGEKGMFITDTFKIIFNKFI